MTKSVIYTCDKCGRTYKSELEATQCEKSHAEILNVKPFFTSHQPYAETITVLFADGKELEYHYYED